MRSSSLDLVTLKFEEEEGESGPGLLNASPLKMLKKPQKIEISTKTKKGSHIDIKEFIDKEKSERYRQLTSQIGFGPFDRYTSGDSVRIEQNLKKEDGSEFWKKIGEGSQLEGSTNCVDESGSTNQKGAVGKRRRLITRSTRSKEQIGHSEPVIDDLRKVVG